MRQEISEYIVEFDHLQLENWKKSLLLNTLVKMIWLWQIQPKMEKMLFDHLNLTGFSALPQLKV